MINIMHRFPIPFIHFQQDFLRTRSNRLQTLETRVCRFFSWFLFLTFLSLGNSLVGQEFELGVSKRLAVDRRQQVDDVKYQLWFDLSPDKPIRATIRIDFQVRRLDFPIVLDFNAPRQNLKQVKISWLNEKQWSGKKTPFSNGHLILPAPTEAGPASVSIQFIAGDSSLNRSESFLYTLLVPDRASTVFPCFDQPDIKAIFQLSLDLPKDWIASANSSEVSRELLPENRNRITFKEPTHPISTYLFAFAAGEFQTKERQFDDRKLRVIFRESDQQKVDRNLNEIFEIHDRSIRWMENYTGIDYPFEKFDFVLIPSFQYGGMEHVGNIFYNADQLFLDESATNDQRLNRASLIAHETAHMWFGNLVTMKWFDDVWLKEVFANFMAAKIVNPGFPQFNHDLIFLFKHHPSAYGEDRSRGTYPIQQRLDNLRNAGTLYGRIIYQKAPIVMRQLETLIGQKRLQRGFRNTSRHFASETPPGMT